MNRSTNPRRALLRAAAAAAVFPAASSGVRAQQAFPSRPIRWVVPFPGGFTDTLARSVGQRMAESLGQPVLVENRPGASGAIGAQEVLRAAADGHTLFLGHIGTHALNPHLQPKLAYDPAELVPVTLLVTLPNLLVTSPTLPVASVQQLVALGRAKPRELSYASPGNGTSGHLAAELLKSRAGIDLVHVPYKGTAEALQDLASGRVQVMFDTVAQGLAQAKAGRVRMLAVTSPARHPLAPDVPTMAESGFPGWDTAAWFGVMVRAGTPPDTVSRLHAEAVRALAAPDVRERLATAGATAVGDTPAEFAAFIRSESARWGEVIRQGGIRAD
jgi:tripartite-type tricarboxylate transporter receptor subunit TctC